MTNLYVFHPTPLMVAKLDQLIRELAPALRHENLIYPEMLDEVRVDGITDAIREKLRSIITAVPQDTAAVILCSCSTLGGCAEEMSGLTTNTIIRIDRPMAEAAVSMGRRIGLAAALDTTLLPTRALLEETAKRAGRAIQIREISCNAAWEHWMRGDERAYIAEIVSVLRANAEGLDVIVLAQGSMAGAEAFADDVGVPILSSPRVAIERVRELLNGAGSGLRGNTL